MKRTKNGVGIKTVSAVHATFEDGGIPTDMTKEDVARWKRQRKTAAPAGVPAFFLELIPIDVPYSGCWLGDRLRETGALSEHEIADVVTAHGASMDVATMWRRAVERAAALT